MSHVDGQVTVELEVFSSYEWALQAMACEARSATREYEGPWSSAYYAASASWLTGACRGDVRHKAPPLGPPLPIRATVKAPLPQVHCYKVAPASVQWGPVLSSIAEGSESLLAIVLRRPRPYVCTCGVMCCTSEDLAFHARWQGCYYFVDADTHREQQSMQAKAIAEAQDHDREAQAELETTQQAMREANARRSQEEELRTALENEKILAETRKMSNAIAAHGAPCTFTPLHEACAAHLFR